MKRIFIVLVVILALAVGVPTAMAQGPTFPTGGTSGLQVVNVSTSPATIAAVYYAEGGQQYTLPAQTLAAQGDSYTYFAEPKESSVTGAPASFQGAAILSSDQEIVAIVNTGFKGNGAGAAYGGFSQGSTSVLLPLALYNFAGQTTAFGVQNTDTQNATTVQVTYTPQSGTAVVKEHVIQPGASKLIDMAAEGLTNGFIGAAKVDAKDGTTLIAAAALVYKENLAYSYSGFTSTSTESYLPLIRSGFANALTGVSVVDASGSGGLVTIAYKGAIYGTAASPFAKVADYTCEVQATLAANSSNVFFNKGSAPFSNGGTVSGGDCSTNNDTSFDAAATRLGAVNGTFLGSAIVTGANAIAVVVNDLTGTVSSGAYNGMLASEAGSSLISPLARVKFANRTTGTQIQNICDTAVTVSVTYKTSAQSGTTNLPTLADVTIQPGASTTLFVNPNNSANSNLLGWLGSVSAATVAGGPSNCLLGITNDSLTGGDASVFNTYALP